MASTLFRPVRNIAIALALLTTFWWVFGTCSLFVSLLVFRYLRLVVHMVSYRVLYKPSPISQNPTITRNDCSVVIPTVDPRNPDFLGCIISVLENKPGQLIIVTIGRQKLNDLKDVMKDVTAKYPQTQVLLGATTVANKRKQVCHALPKVTGSITVMVDDHVFWPSLNFLPSASAPFDNPKTGLVATYKQVVREPTGFSLQSYFNMLGCIYLMRHNFELQATNAIDGSVFVVSGRTSLIRSSIVKSQEFIHKFTHERFFFDKYGPLNADDDNFITRWVVAHDWDIKFQHTVDSTVETTLGTYPRFLSQCLRWVRTTWRSNSAILYRVPQVWYKQPWAIYAIYLTSFVNAAFIYDTALIVSLARTQWFAAEPRLALGIMVCIILASKTVKLIPHWARHPKDILFFPAYVLFAYYHSVLKVWALLTFHDNSWGGRNLESISQGGESAISWVYSV